MTEGEIMYCWGIFTGVMASIAALALMAGAAERIRRIFSK